MAFQRTVPFAGTNPFGLTDPASDWLDTLAPAMPSAPNTFSSSWGSSLMSDLNRFADEPDGAELLAVLAASVRHAKPLVLQLAMGSDLLHLSIFPREQSHACALDMCKLPADDLARLRLAYIESGRSPAPAGVAGNAAAARQLRPLGPLLWLLAMHGPRDALLPEIAGPAKYRLAPGVLLEQLPIDPAVQPALHRLWCASSTLDELAGSTPRGQAQARRLLNALYLQSGLMISRAFSPQAKNLTRAPGSTR
jgi:hypothetical protein